MKYTTPSIEVVNFDRNDAPRVGMQWFYQSTNAPWVAAPAGWTPVNLVDPRAGRDLTADGVDCSSVTWYACTAEDVPGVTDEFIWTDPDGTTKSFVVDDGKSC